MKVDLDYLKKILNEFQSVERSYFVLNDELDIKNPDDEHKRYECEQFIFHMEILIDKNLITYSNPWELGKPIRFYIASIDNSRSTVRFETQQKFRLTDDAQTFISALNKNTIFEKIKEKAGEASLSDYIQWANHITSLSIEAYKNWPFK